MAEHRARAARLAEGTELDAQHAVVHALLHIGDQISELVRLAQPARSTAAKDAEARLERLAMSDAGAWMLPSRPRGDLAARMGGTVAAAARLRDMSAGTLSALEALRIDRVAVAHEAFEASNPGAAVSREDVITATLDAVELALQEVLRYA